MPRIRRTPRPAASRANPLRELLADRERLSARPRLRNDMAADLPSLIETQVDQQFDRLESTLIQNFKQMGQQVIEESTAALNNELGNRIDSLEKLSAQQNEALQSISRTTRTTEGRVHSVVNSIERTLADAVPGGFQLQQAANVVRALPASADNSEMVRADRRELEESAIRFGFCPKCTSGHIRRKTRHGLFENFLRLFFIAPFVCRACRHKFYKF